MRICRLCSVEQPMECFENGKRWQCRRCRVARRNKVTKAENMRRFKLKTKFDLSVEEYDEMYEEQNGLCAICFEPEIEGRRLAVDHDHETGQLRRLLCNRCNRMLGFAKESIEILQNAIDYLTVHKARR